ncbi:MAG: PAS domain S-box protein [Desulfobacteraceae bacterium]
MPEKPTYQSIPKEASHERNVESTFAELAEAIIIEKGIDAITQKILEAGREITSSPSGFVGYIDEDSGHFHIPTMTMDVWDECNVPDKSYIFEKVCGIFGWVQHHKMPVLCNDVANDPRSTGVPAGHISIKRFLSAPALIDDQVAGQVAFANAGREYTDHDLTIIQRLATILASSVLRFRFEKRIKKSEEKFRNLVETSTDWIWETDGSGYLTYTSPRAETILGYKPDDIAGRTVFNFTAAGDDARDTEPLKELMHRKISFSNVEHPCLDREGRKIILESSGVPVINEDGEFSGYRCISRDITDRRQAEKERLNLLRAVEQSPASIVITDALGTIQYVNPAFTRTTGYSAEEAVGENPRILKSGRHPDEFYANMWETIESGRVWKGEICNKKKNGELYWENATISQVLNEKGERISYIAVKEDISSKKELEQRKEDVERVMRHDLKTPLNSIMGFPRLLIETAGLTETQKRYCRNIEYAGKHMLEMINMYLSISGIESGRYELKPGPVNITGTIRQVFKDIKELAGSKSVQPELTVNGMSPERAPDIEIKGEETLCRMLLMNLLKNAVEASPENAKVVVEVTELVSAVSIQIKNQDMVPPEIREHFFNKFISSGKRDGTGLGTYSAKLMTEIQGGSIDMETTEKTGTVVTVTMPA